MKISWRGFLLKSSFSRQMPIQRLPFDDLWFIETVASVLIPHYDGCDALATYSTQRAFTPRIDFFVDRALQGLVAQHLRDYDSSTRFVFIRDYREQNGKVELNVNLGNNRGIVGIDFSSNIDAKVVYIQNPWIEMNRRVDASYKEHYRTLPHSEYI